MKLKMIVITPWPHRAGWGSHFMIGLYLLQKAEQSHPSHSYTLKSILPLYKSTWDDVYVQQAPTGTYSSSLLINNSEKLVYQTYTYFDLIGFNHTLQWNKALGDGIIQRYRHVAQKLVLQPSIVERIDALCTSYPVAQSIGVYFRGTDKQQEVSRPTWESYHEVLSKFPSQKLLIQSDERTFIDMMKQTYGKRVWTLPGITLSTGEPIHIKGNAPRDNLIEIVTIIYVLARCKTLIGNVSNVTHAANLLRNDTVIYV
jgi:hypothetical protein